MSLDGNGSPGISAERAGQPLVRIAQMDSDQVRPVASLHADLLPTHFRSWAGRRLLVLYYSVVVDGPGACAYVAVKGDSVLGYACGVWQARTVRWILLRRHWCALAILGALHGLEHPILLFDKLRESFRPPPTAESITARYELRPIVVAPCARGTDVSRRLLDAVLTDAYARGFRSIHCYVHESNVPSVRFFQKEIARRRGTESREDVPYVHFEF